MDRIAIELAVREILAHPAVTALHGPVIGANRMHLEVELNLGFGNRWTAEGRSPTGVKPVERVRFEFSPGFPSQAPLPSLRPDFSREHAHFQPAPTDDGRPVPCLVSGSQDEFMAVRGLLGLIEQTAVWLRRAAAGTLNDDGAWEPMRRGDLHDSIACDAEGVGTLIREKAGHAFLTYAFRRLRPDGQSGLTTMLHGRLGAPRAIAGNLKSLLCREPVAAVEQGLALVIWADQDVVGEPVFEEVFRPDDVTDMATLRTQLQRFRMSTPFDAAVLSLTKEAEGQVTGIAPIPIILLVRRPRVVLGSESSIELIAYLVQLALPGGEAASDEVRPIACCDDIRKHLLQRLSREPKGQPWALLGAGSLGSKIALHRTRSGAAPAICADTGWLMPHNAARHALYPATETDPIFGWLEAKATHLAEVVATFRQTMIALQADHRALIWRLREKTAPRVGWLVNTTGSTIAREWLAGPDAADVPRCVEAGLFDGGDLSFVSIEGASRNPDTAELMGALFQIARDDEHLRPRLFKAEGQLESVPLGQGCGSSTMVMSDAHLSAMAAPISEILADLHAQAVNGEVHLLRRQGRGLQHDVTSVEARIRIDLEGLDGWSVSLPPEILRAIDADIARWPGVESGGVLIGWSSPISRRLYVLDLLPAPANSRRSAAEFVLGTHGLVGALDQLADDTAGALTCVGTWHSHLGASDPSLRDWASAAAIGAKEAKPMTLLIRGRDGVRAISTSAAAAVHAGRRANG
jgi:hypothetical protein